jgi:GTP-binding protein Era
LEEKFYSGFISIIGSPNVGKSTLLNALVGEKIAIISNKPQTTRNKIQAVLTKDNFQAVFMDTPGIHGEKHKLDRFMQKSVEAALTEIDIILYLIEPTLKLIKRETEIIEKLRSVKTPVFLVINKTDKLSEGAVYPIIEGYKSLFNFAEVINISALENKNLDKLLDAIKKYLPEGPEYFPDDYITDQPEKQIVSEIIREKALMLLRDEIPHGLAVEISLFKQRQGTDFIDIEAAIYCEKKSHKGIIIGKNGEMLKKIGTKARADIENLLGAKVNLQTWVKIKDNWRDNEYLLKNFGYDHRRIT